MAEREHVERSTLRWDRGEAALQSLGGMLGPVRFDLEDGRSISPLHVAPWEDENMSDQPGILQRLRGDWPCIPFGAAPYRPLPHPWSKDTLNPGPRQVIEDLHPHGYGSNHHWDLHTTAKNCLSGTIRYPENHPIEALERHVEGIAGRPEVVCKLTVTPRQDCNLPIGLHPVFRLPENDGDAILDVGPHQNVWSHPLDEDVPLSLVEPNRHFESLDHLWSRDGRPFSLTYLPQPGRSETLLLLTGACGRVSLTNRVGRYRLTLIWDTAVFPSLMLWFSNRGRLERPWNGRHLALGIEPVRAAFDLGAGISGQPNPLNRAGTKTAYAFKAGVPLSTTYRMLVDPL